MNEHSVPRRDALGPIAAALGSLAFLAVARPRNGRNTLHEAQALRPRPGAARWLAQRAAVSPRRSAHSKPTGAGPPKAPPKRASQTATSATARAPSTRCTGRRSRATPHRPVRR